MHLLWQNMFRFERILRPSRLSKRAPVPQVVDHFSSSYCTFNYRPWISFEVRRSHTSFSALNYIAVFCSAKKTRYLPQRRSEDSFSISDFGIRISNLRYRLPLTVYRLPFTTFTVRTDSTLTWKAALEWTICSKLNHQSVRYHLNKVSTVYLHLLYISSTLRFFKALIYSIFTK